MQGAEDPAYIDVDHDISISTKSFQSTRDAQEEADYRVVLSKQMMCGQKRDFIFTMNAIVSTSLHCSYIRLDDDRRQRFIECHHVDCFCKECGKVAHTEPTPVCEDEEEEEEGIPTQCSNKCHHGALVC